MKKTKDFKTAGEILQEATLLCKGTQLNKDGSEYKIMSKAIQEYHNQFIPTPSQLEAMAMAKFPVVIKNGVDDFETMRDIYLSALTDLVKMMGGETI